MNCPYKNQIEANGQCGIKGSVGHGKSLVVRVVLVKQVIDKELQDFLI